MFVQTTNNACFKQTTAWLVTIKAFCKKRKKKSQTLKRFLSTSSRIIRISKKRFHKGLQNMYFFTKHFVMKNYIFFVVVKVFSKQFCDYAVNQVLLKSNFKFITKKHTYLSVHRHSISAREETESARNRFGRPIQSVRTCKQVFIPLSAYCQTNNSNSVVYERRVVERETKT